ncbi:hypothetical protein ACFQ73_21395 [Amycolatopsis japonica]|uniref:hypothetical protein n=1 Tax=Amycolatopsis japonica TaxID=208439 RepID=UPI00366C6B53
MGGRGAAFGKGGDHGGGGGFTGGGPAQVEPAVPATEQPKAEPETAGPETEAAAAPPAKPEPVSGQMSDQPVLENRWGLNDPDAEVAYHDDGPLGTAMKYLGQDALMDVDGQPLANVAGRLATDVSLGRRTAQEGLDDLKVLRDRLPEGSQGHRCLSQAIRQMDGPDTPAPKIPDGTPEPLAKLVRELHAVPLVRREPEVELEPLMTIVDNLAAGRRARARDELQWLRNKRHESLGDSGKFEIDRAIARAVKALDDERRRR